jgi:hypothetical protein
MLILENDISMISEMTHSHETQFPLATNIYESLGEDNESPSLNRAIQFRENNNIIAKSDLYVPSRPRRIWIRDDPLRR